MILRAMDPSGLQDGPPGDSGTGEWNAPRLIRTLRAVPWFGLTALVVASSTLVWVLAGNHNSAIWNPFAVACASGLIALVVERKRMRWIVGFLGLGIALFALWVGWYHPGWRWP